MNTDKIKKNYEMPACLAEFFGEWARIRGIVMGESAAAGIYYMMTISPSRREAIMRDYNRWLETADGPPLTAEDADADADAAEQADQQAQQDKRRRLNSA